MKKKFQILCFIYVVMLIDIVLFKFYGSLSDVVEAVQGLREQRSSGYWNVNLIPFQSINSTLNMIKINPLFLTYTLVGNVLFFMPMGFFVSLYTKKKSLICTFLWSLFFIIIIELIQFITCLGVFDIDDMILNSLGVIIGWFSYNIYRKLFKS